MLGLTKRQDQRGFTLIEILIVIVILSVLAIIVEMALSNFAANGVTAACKTNVSTVEAAVDAYKVQIGVYPGGSTGTWAVSSPGTVSPSYPANVPAPGNTAANQYRDSMSDLLSRYSNGVDTAGGWMRTTPYSAGHYSVLVASDGSGSVLVANAAGNVVSGCSAL